MDKLRLTEKIKNKALALGFDKVGIARAEALDPDHLREWLRKGYHGSMHYMENYFDKRVDPRQLVKDARSVISLAMNYYTPFEHSRDPAIGRISRYAWGDDYHDIIRHRLKQLLAFIQEQIPECQGRVFVDSAPIMDKQWAVRAGIGWQGKNSNVITRDLGSWIFLGEVVVNIDLNYDVPIANYCGSCTRCIEACPTGAIVQPYVVDARRCISYLTIELKPDEEIPKALQPKLGNHIFGCDICQDVCPWNVKFARPTGEKSFYPRSINREPKLKELAKMTESEFRENYRKSPIKRAKYKGFIRNILVALKNSKSRD